MSVLTQIVSNTHSEMREAYELLHKQVLAALSPKPALSSCAPVDEGVIPSCPPTQGPESPLPSTRVSLDILPRLEPKIETAAPSPLSDSLLSWAKAFYVLICLYLVSRMIFLVIALSSHSASLSHQRKLLDRMVAELLQHPQWSSALLSDIRALLS